MQYAIIHTSIGNIKVTLEPLVDAGKAMIQEDVARRIAESERHDAPKRARRLPQIGDFWETCSGTKVLINGAVRSAGLLRTRVVADAGGVCVDYVITADGNFATIDSDYEATIHPLNLKRFIGR